MYNFFLKHEGNIYCAAIRKGGKPGLNVKVNNKIYSFITTTDQTTKLKFKQNTIQNILFKTPGIFVYRLYAGDTQKAVTFYAGGYQLITPTYPVSYFLPTSGVFLSIISDTYSTYQNSIIYYSYNSNNFMQADTLPEAVKNAISSQVTGTVVRGYFHSGEDDGNGGFNYAYCVEERINGQIWYIYARAHFSNFETDPTLISIDEYSTQQDIYYKPGEMKNPVNGWIEVTQAEYINQETQEYAVIPTGNGEIIYDPVTQYYYLITKENDHLTLRRTRDLTTQDWTVLEDLGYDYGGASYRSIGASDLP